MKLEEFLENKSCRNAWVKFRHMDIYVRRGQRMIDGQRLHVIDLANMETVDRFRGQGTLWDLVDLLRQDPEFEGLYVENVLNPQLDESLRERKWIQVASDGFSSSYYMKTCVEDQ